MTAVHHMSRERLLAFLIAFCLVVFSSSAQAMQLASPDFAEGGRLAITQVNDRCGGQNQSPALSWSGAPAGTRSFALTMFDRDAGNGRGFWHWLLFDVPADTQALPAGVGRAGGLSEGATQAKNDFGEAAYGGACPPAGSGIHHYEFTLYAMSAAAIPVDAGSEGGRSLTDYLTAHALAKAALVGIYSR